VHTLIDYRADGEFGSRPDNPGRMAAKRAWLHDISSNCGADCDGCPSSRSAPLRERFRAESTERQVFPPSGAPPSPAETRLVPPREPAASRRFRPTSDHDTRILAIAAEHVADEVEFLGAPRQRPRRRWG
jgi:hypothetical protein